MELGMFVPIILFVLGIVVSLSLGTMGIRVIESQAK